MISLTDNNCSVVEKDFSVAENNVSYREQLPWENETITTRLLHFMLGVSYSTEDYLFLR